jgi:hypothetical protein
MASRLFNDNAFFLATTHKYCVNATPITAVNAVFVRKARPVPIRTAHCC